MTEETGARVQVLGPFVYDGLIRNVGDEVCVPAHYATNLVARGSATFVAPKPAAEKPKPAAEKKVK